MEYKDLHPMIKKLDQIIDQAYNEAKSLKPSESWKDMIFSFKSEKHEILFIMKESESLVQYTNCNPWFSVNHILTALGIEDQINKVKHNSTLYRDVLLANLPEGGEIIPKFVINETGIYYAMIHSEDDDGKDFREWLCKKFFPALRREYRKAKDKFNAILQDYHAD